jgi:hypothetical protein
MERRRLSVRHRLAISFGFFRLENTAITIITDTGMVGVSEFNLTAHFALLCYKRRIPKDGWNRRHIDDGSVLRQTYNKKNG